MEKEIKIKTPKKALFREEIIKEAILKALTKMI